MAIKITQEKIIQINELYLEIGVKSKVAKIVGCSPSTVTKYLIPNYISQGDIETINFDMEIPNIPFELFKATKCWGDLCLLSDAEKIECDELRKEMLI